MPPLVSNTRVNVPSISSTIETINLRVQAHEAPQVKPTPIHISIMPPAIVRTLSKEADVKIDMLWLINQKPAIRLKKAIALTPAGTLFVSDLNIYSIRVKLP